MEPKILFIYPPNQLLPIETPRPDGSLGLLYLAGVLEENSFEVDILDATVGTPKDNLQDTFYKSVMQDNGLIRIGMSLERIKEVVANGKYNIVGISSNFTCQTKMALEVANAVKQVNPEILIIAGGINARNLPEKFLKNSVDIVCLTEGEKLILSLVRNQELDLSIFNNLDELPFPAWHKLPFAHYDKIASERAVLPGANLRYAPIMTSRGCPFSCDYCHISTEKHGIGKLRLKSIDRVIEEIEILRNLGVQKLYFEDDSLLASKKRVQQIFERVQKMNLEITDVNGVNLRDFFIGSKIDRDYLLLLKESGFNQIVFPVESASQRIIDKYMSQKLNLEKHDVVKLVQVATDIGIICPINIMIGFPYETEQEIIQSIQLGQKLVDAGAVYCTFFIPIPFPGSRLFEHAMQNGHLEKNFNPDIFNWKNSVMQNTLVPPERIEELRDWGWRKVNTDEHVARRLQKSIGCRQDKFDK